MYRAISLSVALLALSRRICPCIFISKSPLSRYILYLNRTLSWWSNFKSTFLVNLEEGQPPSPFFLLCATQKMIVRLYSSGLLRNWCTFPTIGGKSVVVERFNLLTEVWESRFEAWHGTDNCKFALNRMMEYFYTRHRHALNCNALRKWSYNNAHQLIVSGWSVPGKKRLTLCQMYRLDSIKVR